ncbi:MAG: GMC family oxidoreductase [Sandaracinaceae bacterium]|nr:GMC family oxidoreductase [Sandaracinaceae bacterium]
MTTQADRVPLALAEALFPGSASLPMADERTLSTTRALLAEAPSVSAALAAAWRALDGSARLTTGRGIADLDRAAQQRVLARFGRVPALSAALDACHLCFGLAHFDRDDVRRALPSAEPPPRADDPPRWARQVVRASEVGEELECDVVVVGTGAGGAVVGAELAARGHAVVFVEEGRRRGRHELGGGALAAHRALFRPPALALGNALIPVLAGRLLGGSTAVNTGTCFRPPEAVLERWCEELATDALSPAALAPRVARVEARLGVAPVARSLVGPVLDVVERGFGALGLDVEVLRRNAEGCEGRGFCDFGCPRGARRSVDVAYLPDALGRGAVVLENTCAERVSVVDGAAKGVHTVCEGRSVFVRARAVVLAAGALESPRVLARSSLGGPALGAHLAVQPSAVISAMMDEPVRVAGQVPQGWCSRALAAEGVLLIGAQADATLAPLVFGLRGEPLARVFDRFDHVVTVGVLVADSATGRLRLGRGATGLARYDLARADVERLHGGLAVVARALHAAGARAIYPGVRRHPVLEGAADRRAFERARLAPRDLLLTSFHPLGTCRLGRHPDRSVVDLDHRVHGVEGLYVVDGSVVPSALGVNPQITIMAMATRAAEGIGDAL